jgi:hypothetical protein
MSMTCFLTDFQISSKPDRRPMVSWTPVTLSLNWRHKQDREFSLAKRGMRVGETAFTDIGLPKRNASKFNDKITGISEHQAAN